MPNCLVVQHVAPESAFAVDHALLAAGVTIDTCRIFAGEHIPDGISELDGLVVMGGPMSATSDEGFPTREAEIAILVEALDAGIPTLGVCLGAQLLAAAGGGSVYRDPQGPEIGWAPVHLAPACQDDPLFTELPRRPHRAALAQRDARHAARKPTSYQQHGLRQSGISRRCYGVGSAIPLRSHD